MFFESAYSRGASLDVIQTILHCQLDGNPLSLQAERYFMKDMYRDELNSTSKIIAVPRQIASNRIYFCFASHSNADASLAWIQNNIRR
jgi:hypothetical protein